MEVSGSRVFSFSTDLAFNFSKILEMKKYILFTTLGVSLAILSHAQKVKPANVPQAVQSAFSKKYPAARAVTWEKEKGNFEANWGGKSGEDHSVQFTPAGEFLESVQAISISQLPKPVLEYVKENFKGAEITEAGRVTDANGKISFEAEVNRKDLVFDKDGKFVKTEE